MTDTTALSATESSAALLASARVLVVDDSRLMRMALIRALQQLGVRDISEAGNGREALARLHVDSFDVMLLDVEMPEMSGIELLLAMKQDASIGRVPVIVISSSEQIETAVRCIEAGADDFLPKTFNPTLLRASVTSSIEKKRLRDLDARRVVELQTEKDRLERTQRRLDEELAEAGRYVQSCFPAPSTSPLRVDWFYQPSTELGGDSFGYHWIDDEHFAVYLLDVCGHGVGACLLSVTAINVIRSGALPNTDFRDPGAVLAALSNAFLCEKQNEMYFTLWYGVYHAPTRTLRHASGGHPPAPATAPAAADEVASSVQLRAPGLIIGVMPDVSYDAQTIQVPPGSCLLVPCDGCFEIVDAEGRDATYEDFEAFMQGSGRVEGGLEALFAWGRNRRGAPILDDDFTIVRIHF